ncbi:MAG: hypothetical protein JNM29_00370 [Candidatus Odyssella sp.]|nr:hypothetical protein [Candidatus Odyssella sp.]
MSKAEYVLGIHDGHNCGAALVRDGAVIAAVSEERLSRCKNDIGYPRRAIEDVMRIGGAEVRDLSAVVYASNFMHARARLADITTWYAVGEREQKADAQRLPAYAKQMFELRRNERIADVVAHLGAPKDRIAFVEHHLAHLAAAYYTAPNVRPGQPVLGLTCDGAGDNLAATVSICRDNAIERIAATDRHASLGKIFSRVTYLMGMTPWEHEYKIMGLAPYADPERSDRAAEPLRRLLRLSADGLRFELATDLSTNYCYEYLRENFERTRFDVVAGAVQRFTEDMLVAWVRACIAHTGIRDVVCAGGVFMNVKANMLIAALPEVRSIYVMPSASDDSLAIGAALYGHRQHSGPANGEGVFRNLYLGGAAAAGEEERAIDDAARQGFSVARPGDMNAAIADLLARGDVVATCRGRMEWGARALGNRSILASAGDPRRVDEINTMIKMRDFWMPFAPSVLDGAARDYFEDPKGLAPPFMTFAYPTTTARYADLAAASHPRDRTIRPQVVTAAANADYHAAISAYRARTGKGAILNTSFNLHGEPIVYTPQDALRVLGMSGLRHLALDRHIVSKPV